jgi:hypothetical protein
MNSRRIAALAVCLGLSSFAVVFAACGGDSSTNDGGVDATSDVTTNPDTGKTDTGTGSDTGTGTDGGTGSDAASDVFVAADACASLGTTAACTTCCQNDYAAAQAELNALVVACACGNGGACNTQCGSNLCDGGAATGQCNSCINQGGSNSCNNKANTACMADAGCAVLLNCIGTCP